MCVSRGKQYCRHCMYRALENESVGYSLWEINVRITPWGHGKTRVKHDIFVEWTFLDSVTFQQHGNEQVLRNENFNWKNDNFHLLEKNDNLACMKFCIKMIFECSSIMYMEKQLMVGAISYVHVKGVILRLKCWRKKNIVAKIKNWCLVKNSITVAIK